MGVLAHRCVIGGRMAVSESTPPAWLADPADPSQLRYWDGEAWTDHVHRPEAPPAPQPVAQQPVTEPDPIEELANDEDEPQPAHVVNKAGYESDPTLLHKKAQAALSKAFSEDESVLVIIRGPSAQAIIGTDRRAFVYKKGFMAGASFGAEITNWTYKHLIGVQIHTGMMSGAVILQAPGQSGYDTSYWSHGKGDPYKAPNAIPITRPYEPAQRGVDRLRELIEAAHLAETTPRSAPATAPTSMADELRKLAEMRRDGLISDTEFDEMKRHLSGG
jgi:hypothetical protein